MDNDLKVIIQLSKVIKGKYYLKTKRSELNRIRTIHPVTIQELELIRDEICDFLLKNFDELRKG